MKRYIRLETNYFFTKDFDLVLKEDDQTNGVLRFWLKLISLAADKGKNGILFANNKPMPIDTIAIYTNVTPEFAKETLEKLYDMFVLEKVCLDDDSEAYRIACWSSLMREEGVVKCPSPIQIFQKNIFSDKEKSNKKEIKHHITTSITSRKSNTCSYNKSHITCCNSNTCSYNLLKRNQVVSSSNTVLPTNLVDITSNSNNYIYNSNYVDDVDGVGGEVEAAADISQATGDACVHDAPTHSASACVHDTPIHVCAQEEDKPKKKKPYKAYGEYKHMMMTEDDYKKLCDDFGQEQADEIITILDDRLETYGNKNKWKNFYLVARKALVNGWYEKERQALKAKAKDKANSSFADDWEVL